MKYNKGAQRKKREKHIRHVVRGASRAQTMQVKKGDKVKVISGKDKGKTGEVLRAFPKQHKIVVEGVAVAKRSLRRTGAAQSGRIIERPMPIDASNVSLMSARGS